jgi:iron complex outermembrane receptor protein
MSARIRAASTVATKRLLAATAAVGSLAPAFLAGPVQAQSGVEEIVVTARKREERLLDIPVAVSAMTARDIETLNLASLMDVTAVTPGFYISGYAAERNDRSTQIVVVRGMPPSINTIPAASVFINGAPVSGSGFVAGVGDLERVEIVKGPQSAYFGRSTFAGAVNLVPKTPGESFKGSVSALYGSSNWADITASIEGPLLADKVGFRLSGRYYAMDGQYRNRADGSQLGGQSTKSVSGVLDVRPNDNLRIKGFLTYWEDQDQAPAEAKFTLARDFNCRGGGTALYMCGELPKFDKFRLGFNFPLNSTPWQNVVYNNSSGYFGPLGLLRHRSPGLLRQAWHADAAIDYEIPNTGITVESVTAYNYQYADNIVNSLAEDMTAVPNPSYPALPNTLPYPTYLFIVQGKVEDFSQELRVTGDQTQRLRWMAGGNFFRNFIPKSTVYGIIPSGPANFAGNPPAGTLSRTWSAFGSLGYDVTDKFTVTLEGRYQSDNIRSVNGWVGTTVVTAQGPLATTFKNFIPRAALQYKITPELMAYASYSKGVNPGTFNTAYATETQARNLAIYAANGIGIAVQPEKLNNYEIGLKGRLWENRIQFTLAAYYAQWKNQIIQIPIQTYNTVASTVLDGIQRPFSNSGNTDLKGIELESTLALTERLTLTANAAFNDSKIKNYVCSSICPLLIGSNNAPVGNHLANTPRWNGLIAGQYKAPLAGDYSWYARTEYQFAGPIYADVTNLAKGPSKNVVNLRLGFEKKDLMVEAFVLNAFGAFYYTVVNRDTDLARTAPQGAIYAGMPLRRQYGVRARYGF